MVLHVHCQLNGFSGERDSYVGLPSTVCSNPVVLDTSRVCLRRCGKRKREGVDLGEGFRVRFSETSHSRTIWISKSDSAAQTPDAGAPAQSDAVQPPEASGASSSEHQRPEQALRAKESQFEAAVRDADPSEASLGVEMSEFAVPTKGTDGPSDACFTTQALIRRLVELGKMTQANVREILHLCAPSVRDGEDLDTKFLYRVLHRLEDLSNRIEANGRTALLPSTVVLSRSLLPALAFLATAVRNILNRTLKKQAACTPSQTCQ